MNLATMRLRFHERCHNVTDDLTDAAVDVWLNAEYSYAIPDDMPGSITDDGWVVATVASTKEYDYPDYVHSIRRGALIDDNPIKMFFRAAEMWARNTLSSTTESKPYAALFYNEKMTLYPVPDGVYTISIPARCYPNDGTTVSELVDAGLTNETHALAVVAGAAAEYLADLGDKEAAMEEYARRQMYMGRLRTRSVSPPKGRRARRDF